MIGSYSRSDKQEEKEREPKRCEVAGMGGSCRSNTQRTPATDATFHCICTKFGVETPAVVMAAAATRNDKKELVADGETGWQPSEDCDPGILTSIVNNPRTFSTAGSNGLRS